MRPFRTPPNPECTHETVLAKEWRDLLGEHEEVLEDFGVAYCSQFAVAKWQIWRRRKEEYQRYYRWLMEQNWTKI